MGVTRKPFYCTSSEYSGLSPATPSSAHGYCRRGGQASSSMQFWGVGRDLMTTHPDSVMRHVFVVMEGTGSATRRREADGNGRRTTFSWRLTALPHATRALLEPQRGSSVSPPFWILSARRLSACRA